MSQSNENQGEGRIVVVGAGQIGRPLVARLARAGHSIRWVSRHRPSAIPEGAEHVALDAQNGAALAEVVSGARAIIAAVNPSTYDAKVWAETLPPLHQGLITAACSARVRLVVLDALYLYAADEGPLSPSTRCEPSTAKGRVRLQLAQMYQAAAGERGLRSVILRASDFWGHGLNQATLTDQAVQRLRAGKSVLAVGNPEAPHAFSHRDDVIETLRTLALTGSDVEGQVFHAPVIHVSQRDLVTAVAERLGVPARVFIAPKWLLTLVGLFSRSAAGVLEMLPQWQAPYLVDDASSVQGLGVPRTSLEEGIARWPLSENAEAA